MKKLLEKLLLLDRRWIFLVVGLVVIIALVAPCTISIGITKPVQSFYDLIENSNLDEPVLVSFDLGASTLPELEPMLRAVVRHVLYRGGKVIAATMLIEGPSIAERILVEVSDELNEEFEARGIDRRIEMGQDWAFFGFRAGIAAVMLALADDIRRVYSTDYYGNYIEDIPMMQDIYNYDQMSAVVTVSGTALPESWVMYAGGPSGIPILVGTTAVSAPNYYAFLQTDQMAGMMGGLKGASEYERLMDYDGMATKGMVAQLWIHITIVLFILIGNIAYFATRGSAKKRLETTK